VDGRWCSTAAILRAVSSRSPPSAASSAHPHILPTSISVSSARSLLLALPYGSTAGIMARFCLLAINNRNDVYQIMANDPTQQRAGSVTPLLLNAYAHLLMTRIAPSRHIPPPIAPTTPSTAFAAHYPHYTGDACHSRGRKELYLTIILNLYSPPTHYAMPLHLPIALISSLSIHASAMHSLLCICLLHTSTPVSHSYILYVMPWEGGGGREEEGGGRTCLTNCLFLLSYVDICISSLSL